VLAAFAAAGTMTVWAISQRRGTADDGSEGHRPRHPRTPRARLVLPAHRVPRARLAPQALLLFR
jgi:hypothetical protein